MNDIAHNNQIIGGNITKSTNKNYHKIIKSSLTDIVPQNDIEELKRLSHNYSIYTWWSNLPVYDCSKASAFLDWIQFNNTSEKITLNTNRTNAVNVYIINKNIVAASTGE